MHVKSAIAAAALVLAVGVTSAAAQDRDRRGDSREPVPDGGMLAVGGSVGAAPPSEVSFTSGLALTGNVEGYLTRRVSLRGQVSGAFWDITGRGFNGTVRPIATEGNVVYNFEGGRIHPFVTGGIGFYHYRFAEHPTTGSANKPGADVGGGLEYFVHRHTTVTGEVLYHDVAEPVRSPVTTYGSTRYWTFTVGLKKYFR